MTNDNIDYLPVWKANATPEERLQELAQVARKYPEQFEKFVLVFQEVNKEEDTALERLHIFNMTSIEVLGMLEMGKYRLLEYANDE